jgi:hypothetical protein
MLLKHLALLLLCELSRRNFALSAHFKFILDVLWSEKVAGLPVLEDIDIWCVLSQSDFARNSRSMNRP